MRLILATLADYTSITREGKLNLLGIFDSIYVREFPVRHRDMMLVLRFEFVVGEANEPQHCAIILMDPDGKKLFTAEGDITPPDVPPGQIVTTNVSFKLNDFPLEKPGIYEVSIFVGDNPEPETIRLNVSQAPKK